MSTRHKNPTLSSSSGYPDSHQPPVTYVGSSMGECFHSAFCGDEGLLSSHFCPHRLDILYSGIYIKVSGSLREAHVGHRHSRPRGEARLLLPLYRSVHLPSTLVDTQLPSDPSTQKWSHLAQEGGLTDYPSLNRCVPPWWHVFFS